MSQIIRVSAGYGTNFAVPFTSQNVALLAELFARGIFIEEYKTSTSGDYSRVWCRPNDNLSMTIIDTPDVFDGTIKEYRDRPATPADLVVQLSAANDQIAALEDTVRSLNLQLSVQSEPLAEAAE